MFFNTREKKSIFSEWNCEWKLILFENKSLISKVAVNCIQSLLRILCRIVNEVQRNKPGILCNWTLLSVVYKLLSRKCCFTILLALTFVCNLHSRMWLLSSSQVILRFLILSSSPPLLSMLFRTTLDYRRTLVGGRYAYRMIVYSWGIDIDVRVEMQWG